jgi:hypothetical protein
MNFTYNQMWISILLTLASSTVTLPLKPLSFSRIPTIKTFTSSSSSTILKVSNYYNLQYYTSIDIGTPGQASSLIIDTGSSWTWVPSTNCTCHESPNRFYSNESSTFTSSGDMIVQYYGMGMISGELFTDKLKASSLSVNNQDMILVYRDKDLQGLASSGLLGLGFNELSDGKKTVIENMKSQGLIESSKFSVYLNSLNGYSGVDSAFVIGGIDETFVGGEGFVLNVSKDLGFWILNIGGVRVNENIVAGSYLGIVDTGTSFLYAPLASFNVIFEELSKYGSILLDSDGFRYFECIESDIGLMPDLWISIEGKEFRISAKNYLFYENSTCYLFVEENDGDYWLLGQVFIREYYVLFDMDLVQITLYPVNGEIGKQVNIVEGMVSSQGMAISLGVFALGVCYWIRKNRVNEKTAFDYTYLGN